MGLKTKFNRLLCIPCNVILLIYQRMKKRDASGLPPLRTIVSLVVVVPIILVTIWSISHMVSVWIYSTFIRNLEHSLAGRHSVEDSFLKLYKSGVTRSNTRTGNDLFGVDIKDDEFSKPNFLHLKLKHLIALNYLSSSFHIPENDKLNRRLLYTKDKSEKFSNTNFTFLLNELNIAIKVQNFYFRQWGCAQLANRRFPNQITKTQHTMTGDVVYNGKNFALQTSIADLDELMAGRCGSAYSDKSHDNDNRCFLLKNRGMLQQYLYLQELSHPNIAKLYGVCITIDQNFSPGTFVLAKETGLAANIEKLQTQSWNLRLKVAQDLVNLAIYLDKSPMGSILLESWSPENFIITQDSSSALLVKLTNFDQKIILMEKSCKYSRDCSIGKIESATNCIRGICAGYNDKFNLHNMYESFLSPLLETGVPSRISSDANKVLNAINNLQCNSTVLLKLLKFLQSSSDNILPAVPNDGENDNLFFREALNRHHDGLQVDSWEQHESNVAINEVDFDQQPIVQNNVQPDINNAVAEEDAYKDTFGYKKIDNADYPGRYDYYCPHSKAEWGCVVSLRKLEEAAKKCDDDPKCKAFVTMPHLRKEGWIIVILKSDETRAVDHAGTTVYIKVSEEIKSKKDKEMADASKDSKDGVVKLCLQDIQAQENIREKREQHMMKACTWVGLTDSKWQSVVLEATISDATKFKPSRGKMAVGGQMNVVLDSASKPSPALFLAKKGPEEFHLAQLVTYHLDRMLGLYKILPAFLRTLTEQEMTDAGFPVDVGGNQFDVFRQLKNADKSLAGAIVPMVSGRIGVEHYISVPKLGQITNAVTPFSRRQWDDLEYLLLMWLASLPMPAKGHPSLQGHLIHIKADEAFKSDPSDEVLSYFNNCQFPRIAIDVLRNLRSAHCNFGDHLIARVRTTYPDLPISAFSFKAPVADIATRNANRLLEVVDYCVRKFGDTTVLYDS